MGEYGFTGIMKTESFAVASGMVKSEAAPENIIFTPCDDDGNYLMDEAAIIPIMPGYGQTE